MKLDRLYGMNIDKFSDRLANETGLTIDDLIAITTLEIKILRESYMNLVKNREVELDVELITEINTSIKSKREKLQRYKEYKCSKLQC